MTVDDKFTLQDGGVLPKQYELTEDSTDPAPLSAKTEQDNAAHAAIEKQRRDLEILRARTAVIQDLYSVQGEILSRWIRNGAVGEAPTTLSWTQCETRANELIEAARSGNLVSDELLLDQECIDNITKAAGIEKAVTKQIDSQYKLEVTEDNTDFTLINPEEVVPLSEKVAGTNAGRIAKKTFTAITHPKETLAQIKFHKQIEKILEADSVDYEEILRQLRSDVIVARDVVITAVRSMVLDIEQYGSHNLCELIAASSRLSTTLPEETQLCVRNAILDMITSGQADYATDFINELRLTNHEACIGAIDSLSNQYRNNEDIISIINSLRNVLNASHFEIKEDNQVDSPPPAPEDDMSSVVASGATPLPEVIEEKPPELIDHQIEPTPVVDTNLIDVIEPIDKARIEEKLTDLLDDRTEAAAPDEAKSEPETTQEVSKTTDNIREEVVKRLQETPFEELGKALDKLRADHSDLRNEIDEMATEIIRDRVHENVTSPSSNLTEVETLLNNLYEQGLVSAHDRRDLLLDYSESYRERNSQKQQDVPAEKIVETIVDKEEIQRILLANSPLTEDEISKLREYAKYIHTNEPHREKEVRKMIVGRVIAPILVEDLQSEEGYERLQNVYTQIREQIHGGLVSQPEILRALENDLYQIVNSDSSITSKIRKRLSFLKTIISNFSSANKELTNTLSEADNKMVDRQILFHGIMMSENDGEVDGFVTKYAKSISKVRKLGEDQEKELETVIRAKKELLKNATVNEIVELCKDPKQDYSEKLFDLLKDAKDIYNLAKLICEKLLEENRFEAVPIFISALKEKQLFINDDVNALLNTLVSISVTNEIKTRNLRNVQENFRNDLIRALFAHDELFIELSGTSRIVAEILQATENEEMVARFIKSCEEIGIPF